VKGEKYIYEGMWIRYGGPNSLNSPKGKKERKFAGKNSVQFQTAKEKRGKGKNRQRQKVGLIQVSIFACG
jgi:hypothetical protein